MLSNAADEVRIVIRYADAGDDMDLAHCEIVLSCSLRRINQLYGEGKMLGDKTSYTSLTLKTLDNPMTLSVGSVHKQIRRPSEAVIARCLARMQAWCRWAAYVLETERHMFSMLRVPLPNSQ